MDNANNKPYDGTSQYFIRYFSKCFSFVFVFFLFGRASVLNLALAFIPHIEWFICQNVQRTRHTQKKNGDGETERLGFMCDLLVVYFEIYFQMVVYLSEIYMRHISAAAHIRARSYVVWSRAGARLVDVHTGGGTLAQATLGRNSVPVCP